MPADPRHFIHVAVNGDNRRYRIAVASMIRDFFRSWGIIVKHEQSEPDFVRQLKDVHTNRDIAETFPDFNVALKLDVDLLENPEPLLDVVKKDSLWKNKKNEKIYIVEEVLPDYTNSREGQYLVIYRNFIDSRIKGGRELGEFIRKFDLYHDSK